ncbi:MAG: hypothetical protein E7118_04665 [Bacteroidales bacterium]|nr:hypothetical protein [Bacteroidales bacterium]
MAARKQTYRRKGVFGMITSRVLMMIVAAMLVLSYVSIVINPARLWAVSLVGLIFVPLSIVNLLLLIWALKRRSRSFLIPLLALLPSLFFLGRYVQTEKEIRPADDPVIKVISYNVGRFASYADGTAGRVQCADSIFSYLKGQNADVICLQEFHVRDVDAVRSYLSRNMKGYSAEYYLFPLKDGSAFGNLTLSRIPVSGKGKLKFEESANLAIYTDYEMHGRRFRVYNCHFESYNISLTGILKRMFKADPDVFLETGNKMKASITRRPKQVDKVFSHIESCPVEAFVCGDFNDNPMSYSYYRMTRGKKDTFVEAGSGLGATFAKMWPMLRIDYVLYPERFRAVSHSIPRIAFSDHYPVVAEIEL